MSAYIKLSTGEYPRHQGDIRLEYPDMGEEFVCPDTYELVPEVQPPETNSNQVSEELKPELIDGVWRKRFVVRDLTEQEIAERTAMEEMIRRSMQPIAPNTDQPGSEPDVIG